MGDFSAKLRSMVSLQMTAARRASPEAVAEMIESLTNSLGMIVAIASGGDAEKSQELLTGAENYLYEAVAQHSPLAKLLVANTNK